MATIDVPLALKFRITLVGILPAIWRSLIVPKEFTFYEFHVAIQDVMGWKHIHPYQFYGFSRVKDAIAFVAHPQGDLPLSEIDRKIKDHFECVGDICYYMYDTTSHWVHEVSVEEVQVKSPHIEYPICISGSRTCPPEGLGGISYYYKYMQALANKDSKDYAKSRALLATVGGAKSPLEFDRRSVVFSKADERYRVSKIRSVAPAGDSQVLPSILEEP